MELTRRESERGDPETASPRGPNLQRRDQEAPAITARQMQGNHGKLQALRKPIEQAILPGSAGWKVVRPSKKPDT